MTKNILLSAGFMLTALMPGSGIAAAEITHITAGLDGDRTEFSIVDEKSAAFPLLEDVRKEFQEFSDAAQPLKIYAAHVELNETKILILKPEFQLSICGNAGCPHLFYRHEDGDFQKLDTRINLNEIAVIECAGKEQFFFYGGPGVNRPSGGIWRVEDQTLDHVSSITLKQDLLRVPDSENQYAQEDAKMAEAICAEM